MIREAAPGEADDLAERRPHVLVAEEGGVLVAVVAAGPSGEEATGEIEVLRVEPEHEGRGLGRSLLRKASEALAEDGCRQAITWVEEVSGRGRRFLESAGWKPDGARDGDRGRYRTVLVPLPSAVAEAHDRADDHGFARSCLPGVGQLLAVLAAAVPENGRILELGTGAGVSLAWMATGLGDRQDVELVTVDVDDEVQDLARQGTWPDTVRFVTADALAVIDELGKFDLVFADAPAGKWEGVEKTIAALAPAGLLVVDDMWPFSDEQEEWRAKAETVRRTLFKHPELATTELADASGVIVATRRRT